MIVHSILFREPRKEKRGKSDIERQMNVLAYSIALNSPRTPFVRHDLGIEPDRDIDAIRGKNTAAKLIDNARKTKHHCRIVQESRDGEMLSLIDCDTLIMRDLGFGPGGDFDFAYTLRPDGSRFLFNSGVVFVRVSERTKLFYRDWYAKVRELLPRMKSPGKPPFGGINQTALGHMLSTDHGLKILALDCQTWNYEDCCYRKRLSLDNTKIVHLKGEMGRYIIGPKSRGPLSKVHQHIQPVVEKWREYEVVVNQQLEVA